MTLAAVARPPSVIGLYPFMASDAGGALAEMVGRRWTCIYIFLKVEKVMAAPRAPFCNVISASRLSLECPSSIAVGSHHV